MVLQVRERYPSQCAAIGHVHVPRLAQSNFGDKMLEFFGGNAELITELRSGDKIRSNIATIQQCKAVASSQQATVHALGAQLRRDADGARSQQQATLRAIDGEKELVLAALRAALAAGGAMPIAAPVVPVVPFGLPVAPMPVAPMPVAPMQAAQGMPAAPVASAPMPMAATAPMPMAPTAPMPMAATAPMSMAAPIAHAQQPAIPTAIAAPPPMVIPPPAVSSHPTYPQPLSPVAVVPPSPQDPVAAVQQQLAHATIAHEQQQQAMLQSYPVQSQQQMTGGMGGGMPGIPHEIAGRSS